MYQGQKVICVDDKYQDGDTPCVIEGETYIIRGFSPITTGVYLMGIYLDYIRPGVERAFRRERFREIDSNFAEDVMEFVLPKENQEELKSV